MSALLALLAIAQTSPADVADRIRIRGLTDLGAYRMLSDLCENVGPRLSGSPGSEKAIAWSEARMAEIGLANIRQIPCKVPVFVRGPIERCEIVGGAPLTICALGGSGASPKGGVSGQVIELKSLAEVEKLGEGVRGKIVFFNRPFDATLANPGAAYGGANDQRTRGPATASKFGAIATLVRSMTHADDDVPHTGATNFGDVPRIPAAALGPQSADRLSRVLKADPTTKVEIELACENLPDKDSASVIGEIVGSERPKEVIVIGGHLDSWDKGRGAHDDGAGITQSLEALRLLKVLGLRPKRTIRAVMFMNEENGLRGARAYADWAKTNGETAYAGLESDSGGFMPRAFGVLPRAIKKVRPWEPWFRQFGIERFVEGGRDADNGPLEALGATLFSLEPETQRYFDYHHSDKDTIDKVHPRELQMGANAMALLVWLISEQGV